MKFPIRFYRPSKNLKSTRLEDGAVESECLTKFGLVKLFSYQGGCHGDPFTRLDLWYHGRLWYVNIDHAYDERWHVRIANTFARQVANRRFKGVK